MKLKRFLQNSNKGFSLLEILVSIGLISVIGMMVSGAIIAQKNIYNKDVSRSQSNQDLRGLFNLIASEVRLAGERLPATFPAILLSNGASGGPDSLTLRRNLMDVVLKLCTTVGASGSINKTNIDFSQKESVGSPVAGCAFSSNEDNYNTWLDYWNDELGGGTQRAFMFRKGASSGEFFEFEDIKINGSGTNQRYRIVADSGVSWGDKYTRTNDRSGSIYMLEEWELSLNGNILQLVEGGDVDNALNLSSNITDFQVVINMRDGSIENSFDKDDNWVDIKTIEIAVTSINDEGVSSTWTSKYFPRNILSTYDSN